MAKVNWTDFQQDAAEGGRVVVVPRTPDFDRPFNARVPKPPQRKAQSAPPAPKPVPQPTKAPQAMGITIAIVAFALITFGGLWFMRRDHQPSLQERQLLAAKLASAQIAAQETPKDFIDSMNVTMVRLAGDQTRANINGELYRVGQLIDEHHGIIFAGSDPDGEYLLFRDGENQTHFYSLYKH